jgi:hypothetical protein
MNDRMNKPATRRVTANLPKKLLRTACRASGRAITETLVQGLEMVARSGAAQKAKRLKGRLHLKVDLGVSRERPGH